MIKVEHYYWKKLLAPIEGLGSGEARVLYAWRSHWPLVPLSDQIIQDLGH